MHEDSWLQVCTDSQQATKTDLNSKLPEHKLPKVRESVFTAVWHLEQSHKYGALGER